MNFRAALHRFLLRWRLGLCVTGIFRAVAVVGLVLLALGVFDFYAALSDPARRVAFGALTVVAALALAWTLWDAVVFMRRDAAGVADAALGTGRRDVLSALELHAQPAGESALGRWLQERTVAGAEAKLKALPVARSLPLGALRRRVWQALGVAAIFGALAVLVPAPFKTVGRRLLDPRADIPPYSPLHFTLGPADAEVLYGGEMVVTAEITGGKLDAAVRCIARDPATGRTEETPAFQENATRFARKLEKVTAPVEVAFTVGRARSAWLPVNVRTQPKIQDVLLTIEPPAYTGLPRREFAAGTQELVALPGSRITAQATSNRPLAAGQLAISQPAQEIEGARDDTHRVRFSWVVKAAARLSLTVRDVAGTMSEPVQLEQKLLPDERPEVALRQPAGDVLATPDTELPLEAAASDDLGLVRVALVRKLVGYRERAQPESVQTGLRRHEMTGRLNLAAFGVLPGQTIEVALEAGDTNPNLLGVSVSDPARIHIITRETYAEMLRDRTTLEEFAERYAALAEAMQDARKSLEALEAAVQSGDARTAEEARKRAYDAHSEAAKLFGKIAKDFPIYDLDAALAEAANAVAEKLFENGKELDALQNAAPGDLAAAVPGMKKRLGESEQRVANEMELGKRALAAGRVIDQAGRFKELLKEQRELVKDFNRMIEQIRRGETQAGSALRDLAAQQREIAEGLRTLDRELDAALEALPEEFVRMQAQGREFLELLRAQEVPPIMDAAANSADAADSRIAGERASEALRRLEELLKKPNDLCSMCRGGEEGFPWPEDLAATLRQLMQSLIQRRGSGRGGSGGSGEGMSGSSDHGFTMRGSMPRLPMFGPPRTHFGKKAGPQIGGAGRSGSGKGGAGREAGLGRNEMAAKSARNSAGEGAATEAVPESYREAVKRYFSTEPSPTPQP